MSVETPLFHKLFTPTRSSELKNRCIRGGFFLTCGTCIDRALAFVRNMILTRLLLPEEMGIMTILLSTIGLFDVITDVGIKIAVIQNVRGAEPSFVNMAWWFQTIRGVVLYLVGLILTPVAFWFFFSDKSDVLTLHSKAEIYQMIQIIFLVVLFNSLINPMSYVLEKKMEFAKVVFLNQGSLILGTLLTIGLCFYYKSVWSIIWGNVVSAGLRSVLSFILCPFSPKISMEWTSLRELFSFAKRMFGVPILTYLALNIDILVLGRLVSAKEVGLYGMAMALAAIPKDLFSKIINPVLLPAFSQKQNQPEVLSRKILQISDYISIIGFCFLPIIFVFGRQLISIVYGPIYEEAKTVFMIMCVTIIVYVHSIIQANVLLAVDKPEKHRWFTSIRVILMLVLIYPLAKQWGIIGAAAALFISNFLAFILQIKVIKRLIGFSESKYWQSWLSGAVSCGVILGLISGVSLVIPNREILQMFLAFVICGVAVSYLFYRTWVYKQV